MVNYSDLITEDFDLTVAPVEDRSVPGIFVRVDLEVERQTLGTETCCAVEGTKRSTTQGG